MSTSGRRHELLRISRVSPVVFQAVALWSQGTITWEHAMEDAVVALVKLVDKMHSEELRRRQTEVPQTIHVDLSLADAINRAIDEALAEEREHAAEEIGSLVREIYDSCVPPPPDVRDFAERAASRVRHLARRIKNTKGEPPKCTCGPGYLGWEHKRECPACPDKSL